MSGVERLDVGFTSLYNTVFRMKDLASKNCVEPGDRVTEGGRGTERHFDNQGKWKLDPDPYGQYHR